MAAPKPSIPQPVAHAAAANATQRFHRCPEHYDWLTRARVLERLREFLDAGVRDPELLYLGARFAASLGCEREARRFLDPLAQMLRRPDGPVPAFLPVGFLYLRVLSAGQEREAVIRDLRALAERNPKLTAWLNRTGVGPSEAWLADSPAFKLQQLRTEAQERNTKSSAKKRDDDEAAALVELAGTSSDGYRARALADVRASLETMLLMDGDQPDVLRNLVVVASEQQDREAYERYFRRCVKVLLWRILRSDGAAAAREDLIRFYVRVATVADREFSDTAAKSSERIRTPGLLARWLESHAGLVWLESIDFSRKSQQTLAGQKNGSERRLGRVSLMRFWFRVFYPEFAPYLAVGFLGQTSGEPPPGFEPSHLPFDPAAQFLKRFVAWSKFNFGLQAEPGDHNQIVAALAGCAARIPHHAYTPALAQILGENETNPPDFRQAFHQACSLSLKLKLGSYIEAKDWNGLAAHAQEADLMAVLTAEVRSYIAYALCLQDQDGAALDMVFVLLPQLLAEQLKPEAEPRCLCKNVLIKTLQRLQQEKPDQLAQELAKLKKRIEAVPDTPALREFKTDCVNEIDQLEQNVTIGSVIRRSEKLLEEADFNGARQAVQELAETSDEVRKFKATSLERIDQAEKNHSTNKMIETALAKSRKLLDEGKEAEAKRAITELPDDVEEVRKLKAQFLAQIDEIVKTRRKIDGVIQRAKEFVEKRKFNEARRCLGDLPKDNDKLKSTLLEQIQQAEEQASVQDRVNFAVDQAKKAISKGDFREARKAINALPDHPAHLKDLKKQFLSQVSEAEKEWENAKKENPVILSWLVSHNVNLSKVYEFASHNNVDTENPLAFNGLLKAIQNQLK